MALSWWGKRLWQICMHHWRVHVKVEFPRLPPDVRTGGCQSSFNFWCWSQKCKFCIDILHGVSYNIKCITAILICIYNRKYSKWTFSHDLQLMGNRFMANLHASLESICKSRISKIATRCQKQGVNHFSMCGLKPELKILGEILVRWGVVNHLSTWCWSQKCFALISFMGFPTILSALQPFQICIYNRKHSKSTSSNGSQLVGKLLWQICMHHWRVHVKVEFPRLPPDVRTGGCQSSFNFWCWSQKCKFCIDILHGVSYNIKCITAILICIYNRKYSKWTFSHDLQLMDNRFMANLHASLESTCKSRISKIATRCQKQGVNHISPCVG